MPNAERRPWTAEGLKKRITGCTKKIGEAARNQDDSAGDILRERRATAMKKLAQRFDVWTLINPEGQTEFVDRAEWEQRMIAWGRRTGNIPRGRLALGQVPPMPRQRPVNDAVNPEARAPQEPTIPPLLPPIQPPASELGGHGQIPPTVPGV